MVWHYYFLFWSDLGVYNQRFALLYILESEISLNVFEILNF